MPNSLSHIERRLAALEYRERLRNEGLNKPSKSVNERDEIRAKYRVELLK